MKEKVAYVKDIKWMSANCSMHSYTEEHPPASIVYSSGIYNVKHGGTYLELGGEADLAIEWLCLKLSEIDTSRVDSVLFVSSTLHLGGDFSVSFWERLSQAMKSPKLREVIAFSGRGCNSLVYAVGFAANKVKGGEWGSALVICVELHDVQINRFSDYAFFSDAAALFLVSSDVGDYEVVGNRTAVLRDTNSFALSNQFLAEPYRVGTKMFSLNTYPFLLGKKYGKLPEELLYEVPAQIVAHSYSLDPLLNAIADSSTASHILLHVESPPFHVDEVALKRVLPAGL